MVSKKEEHAGLPILPFTSPAAFEKWLDGNGEDAPGFWMKLGKKTNPDRGITYPEAVEVALCFGWIDGQVYRYDDLWYLQRFTPRRSKSIWSQKNVERIEQLIADGRLRPAGLAQVEAAKADGRWERAYAGSADIEVPADLQAALDADPDAAAAFAALKRGDRYSFLARLHLAVRPQTRAKHIAAIVEKMTAK